MKPVCTGFGANDTRALILNDGRPNLHASAGQPYNTVGPVEIINMITDPPSVPKNSGQWIIPSAYHSFDARSHSVQRQQGEYEWLAADIDRGNPSLTSVVASVTRMLPDVYFAVYSSRSATPEERKWRVLFPLASPIPGDQYSSYQAALFDGLAHAGLELDRTLERTGQLVYLPNRGEHYEYHLQDGAALDAPLHPLAKRAAQYQEIETSRASEPREEGPRSYLAAFRRKHSIPEMLTLYGYTNKPGTNHWRSPSASGYSTQDRGDHWISLSYTDAEAGIGKKTANGSRYGDAYDIFLHYQGDPDNSYAKQCLVEEDANKYGAATAEHGRTVWDIICTVAAQIDAARLGKISTIPLDAAEGNNPDWELDWPPGLVGEIAKYVYLQSPRPIKQFSIATALYIMGFAGRKYNIEGHGLNLYLILVAGTGRGKGVMAKTTDRIMHALRSAHQEDFLHHVFGVDVPPSAEGLKRKLSEQPILGTYREDMGETMLAMATAKDGSNDAKLRSALTSIWDASGEGNILGERNYSDKEKDSKMVHSPCLTFGGDMQPKLYRQLLGTGMTDTGLTPRIIPFVFYGTRAYFNKDRRNHLTVPPGILAQLANIARFVKSSEVVVPVRFSPEALIEYDSYDTYYTDLINRNAPGAELGNRAQINVAKIAATVAVGMNHLNPEVTPEVLKWSKAVLDQGLDEALRIMASGEAGSGESVRAQEVLRVAKIYLTMPPGKRKASYSVPSALCDFDSIIPECYFIRRLKPLSDFKGTDNGLTSEDLVRRALKELVQQDLIELATKPLGCRYRGAMQLYKLGAVFD